MDIQKSHIKIIGAGLSGVFLAINLLKRGHTVDLYDQTSSFLKKFLIAGKGGLNLTHSEDLSSFYEKYGENKKQFEKYIGSFTPLMLRKWFRNYGVETFVGTSKRVFPKDKVAGDLLKIFLTHLRESQNFSYFPRHTFKGFLNGILVENEKKEMINLGTLNIVLSLGGGSYSQTGSDGKWVSYFKKMGIEVKDLRGINCGFKCHWSEEFKLKKMTTPLKNITLTLDDKKIRGELLLTEYGVEGSGIYFLSRLICQKIEESGHCLLSLDLKPDLSIDKIEKKLNSPRNKNSLSNFLRKSLNIERASFLLLKENSSKEIFLNNKLLAKKIKSCEIKLIASRPMNEAISTSGGICFSEVTDSLMLKKYSGVYVMGEMLNWDAPTGGYLFQGCFSMAKWIEKEIESLTYSSGRGSGQGVV